MVDQRLLAKKTAQIHTSLALIERYKGLSFEEFLRDEIAQSVVEYHLFIIINQMIDIANHLVADRQMGTVEYLSDGFKIFHQKGFIAAEEMDTYVKMTGFRNILAHQYSNLDKKIVFDAYQTKLPDFKKFLVMLEQYFC